MNVVKKFVSITFMPMFLVNTDKNWNRKVNTQPIIPRYHVFLIVVFHATNPLFMLCNINGDVTNKTTSSANFIYVVIFSGIKLELHTIADDTKI